jgi:hypothetical protein
VREFFFYDKKVTPNAYFDTTVGYSFQVVVTIYFVYWGFKYGIGVLYYAFTWLLGFWFFQLCSRRLGAFAVSDHTLHSFLAERFGTSLMIRRLTAFCTLFGLVGALLIEMSYTTDILTGLSTAPVSIPVWIFVFAAILALTWLFVQHGGFKAVVITDVLELPVTYGALAVLLAFLNWLNYRAGYRSEGIRIGLLMSCMWAVIVIARSRAGLKGALRDKANLAAVFGVVLSLLTTLIWATTYGRQPALKNPIPDLPDAFSLTGLFQQGIPTLLGFTILNLSWQFFDMTAWQRVSSLDLQGLSEDERQKRLSRTIGETKWESPVTWVIGILIGIALHYSGLFHSAKDADGAFNGFVKMLSDNDFAQPMGMLATYVALPALVVAFLGIMLTTVDSFLVTSIFTWTHDITLDDTRSGSVEESLVLKKVRRASLAGLIAAAAVFVICTKLLNANVFLLLNTVYSAQFAISFFTLGALFLQQPAGYRKAAVVTVVVALIANYATAGYCYWRIVHAPDSQWPDYFYVLPTVVSAACGCFAGVGGLLVTWVGRRSGR